MIQPVCTGIILAGGESKRLNGVEKSSLSIGDQRIIERMMSVFTAIFEEIILVSNHPTTHLEWDAVIVKDIYPKRSSLTGIHTGLFYTQTEHAFIAACDIPFLRKDLVTAILRQVDSDVDLVLPRTKAGIEPLCAVYSRRCLQHVQNSLRKNQLKIRDLFGKFSVKEIPEAVLRKTDPDLLSFFNINTPSDLEKAKRMMNADRNRTTHS